MNENEWLVSTVRRLRPFLNPSFMTFQTHAGMETVIHTSNLFISDICFIIFWISDCRKIQKNFLSIINFPFAHSFSHAYIDIFSYYIKISFYAFSRIYDCVILSMKGVKNKRYWQDIMGSANYFHQVTSFKRLALLERLLALELQRSLYKIVRFC